MERLRPEEFVDCWDDNERMDFLFSSFPADVTANPEHWRSKMEFWSDLIVKLCEISNSIRVDIDLVASWLERDGRRPMGLQIVWDSMVRNGELVSTQEYVGDLARNSSWVGWGLNIFVRKPTLWMAGKMLSPLKSLSPVKTTEQRKSYICVKSFQQKSQKLMQIFQSRISKKTHGYLHIISLHELEGLSQIITGDQKELEMLLLALEKDKKVVVFNKNNAKNSEKFVKFAKGFNDSVTPVNEGDLGVLKLEHTKQALEQQISMLYTQQSELVNTAKHFIHVGERFRAKSTLCQKQRLMLNIKRKEGSLNNIEQLLFKLEQCGTDQMVLDAYKAGMSAYREKSKGMTVDDVDSTMDDLQAALDDQEQITSALSTSIDDDAITDELEKELEDLLAEDESDLVSNQTDADIAKLITGISTDVCIPAQGLPSRHSRFSFGVNIGESRDRGDEIVSSQTDADIAKLMTGMAATSLSEPSASGSSPQRHKTAQLLP